MHYLQNKHKQITKRPNTGGRNELLTCGDTKLTYEFGDSAEWPSMTCRIRVQILWTELQKKKSISKLAQFFIIKYRRWTYSAEANSEIRGIEKLSCRHFVLFSFFSALPLTKCLLDLASQGPARQTAVFVFSWKFQRRGMKKDWHIRKNVKSSQSTAKISMIGNQG